MFKLNVLAMSESTIFASAGGEKFFFLHVARESTVIVTFVDFDIQL